MKVIWKLLIVYIIAVSCNDNSTVKNFIDPDNFIIKRIPLSEIIQDIQYIPLDNEYPISLINKISVSDNTIFLSVNPTAILSFDMNGIPLNRIGKAGRGPGEYKWSRRFSIDDADKQIYVLDKHRILVFNSEGDYSHQILINNFETNFSNIVVKQNKIFLFEGINRGYGKYDWLVLNSTGKLLYSKQNSIKKFDSKRYCIGNTEDNAGNGVFYWNQINDTIYSIYNEEYSIKGLFDNGDFRFPMLKTDYTQYFYPNKLYFTDYYTFLAYSYDNYYYTAISETRNGEFYIVNKSHDKGHVSYGPGIINDFDSGLPFVPRGYYKKNGQEYLFGYILPYSLKDHTNSKTFINSVPKFPQKKKELLQMSNNLNIDDNPIIMIAKLKYYSD